jgi:hypothetical protein
VPGHILVTQCDCGFECGLSPGATVEQLYVIAYTADGRDLITIESEQAKNESLTVIDDPCLKEAGRDGPWGPYRCPSCGQQTLRMEFSGFWD